MHLLLPLLLLCSKSVFPFNLSSYYASQKKTLELNPKHPLVKQLLNRVNVSLTTVIFVYLYYSNGPLLRLPSNYLVNVVHYMNKLKMDQSEHIVEQFLFLTPPQTDAEDQTASDLAVVLFETATLRSGYQLADTKAYGDRIERMLRLSLNVPLDEQASHCSSCMVY